MQRAIIARNGIYIAVINGERRADIAARELNRANKLRQIGGIHTYLAKVAANDIVAIDHQAAGPVETAIVNRGAAGNGARVNIDALNGAVLHVNVIARPLIKGIDVDVVAVNGQRGLILHGEGIGIPQCLERLCRNSLQVTTRKRNQNDTLRNNRTAGAIHGRAKLKSAHNGARSGINLIQDSIPRLSAPYRGARDKVHLSICNNGIGRRNICARLLLLFGQKVKCP